MPSINWSEIDPMLPALIQAGFTQEEIGKQFKISSSSIGRRIVKLGLWHEFDLAHNLRQSLGKSVGGRKRFHAPKERLINRKCLCCRRRFIAEGRFFFLCPECRKEATLWL